jgi:hypothetical protein
MSNILAREVFKSYHTFSVGVVRIKEMDIAQIAMDKERTK